MALTHLTGLSVKKTTGEGGGTVSITGPLTVSGTVVHTGGYANRTKGDLVITGSVTITGGSKSKLNLRADGTGALCGIRTISTGGSAVITSTKFTQTSVLLLTPLINTALVAHASEKYSARSGAAGTFKVMLRTGTNTGITGRIAWMILN